MATYPLEGGCDCRQVRYRLLSAPLVESLERAKALRPKFQAWMAEQQARDEGVG